MCDDGWNWEDAEVVCIGTWVTLAIVVSLTRITGKVAVRLRCRMVAIITY